MDGRYRIGASLGCYLPWAALLPGNAVLSAYEAGFEFLQGLPLKGLWNHGRLDKTALNLLPVDYLEDAWNEPPESLFQAVMGQIRKDPKAPLLLWVFFGPNAEAIYLDMNRLYSPKLISHAFGWAAELIEVHPGLWMRAEEIRDKVVTSRYQRHHVSLVLDTWHMRHEPTREWLERRPEGITTTESLLGSWQSTIELLRPFSSLVHVQPSRDWGEARAFIREEGTELEEMLLCIKESGGPVDLVVEATLGAHGLNYVMLEGMLRDFRCRLDELMNN